MIMFSPTTYWTDDEPLQCVSVVSETSTTSSFTFRAPSGAHFSYKPGQFLTVEIPVSSGVVHRTYTISSSPTQPEFITLTVKAQVGSVGTRWMIEHLKPGMLLKMIGPAGSFTNSDSDADKFLFISAGSGVTPMMSMTAAMQDEDRELDVNFIYCARTCSDIIFHQRLNHMASVEPGLNLNFVFSQPDLFDSWNGYLGRLNASLLQDMAPDLLEREIYCCGPGAFMESVKASLTELDYDLASYHEESFSGSTDVLVAEGETQSVDMAQRCEIKFIHSGLDCHTHQSDSILSVARSAGIVIPSACTFGVCGTCKIKKLSGDVNMKHSGGISESDINEGYILACCSYPLGVISIEA